MGFAIAILLGCALLRVCFQCPPVGGAWTNMGARHRHRYHLNVPWFLAVTVLGAVLCYIANVIDLDCCPWRNCASTFDTREAVDQREQIRAAVDQRDQSEAAG